VESKRKEWSSILQTQVKKIMWSVEHYLRSDFVWWEYLLHWQIFVHEISLEIPLLVSGTSTPSPIT